MKDTQDLTEIYKIFLGKSKKRNKLKAKPNSSIEPKDIKSLQTNFERFNENLIKTKPVS
jgi:hypothetical protein